MIALPARITVNSLVYQTGTHAGRLMRVAAVHGHSEGHSAHCEWVHDGKWHADWFCISGLRRAHMDVEVLAPSWPQSTRGAARLRDATTNTGEERVAWTSPRLRYWKSSA